MIHYIFFFPTDEKALIEYAKRHIDNPIDFSNGVRCPDPDCQERPFLDSQILFLHVLLHKDLLFVCGFCPRAYTDDNDLSEHFENQHSETHKMPEHLALKIDTFSLLTEKWINLPEQPPFTGTPTLCSYKMNAHLVTACQFPQTAQYIKKDFEVTKALLTCKEIKLLTTYMLCPIMMEIQICDVEFASCREMLLHIATYHFKATIVCQTCFEFYYNVDEALTHMESVHHGCTTCGDVFSNSDNLDSHKIKIEYLTEPYKTPDPMIDLNCKLYLPNLAFHHQNNGLIDYQSALQIKHCCIDPKYNLTLSLKDTDDARSNESMQLCLKSSVVHFYEFKECDFDDSCNFKYSKCRQILVHKLLKHSSVTNYMYVCSICYMPHENEDNIMNHIHSSHSTNIFCRTCMLWFDSPMTLVIHQHSLGHFPVLKDSCYL